MRTAWVLAAVLLVASGAPADERPRDAFERARKLERSGQFQEAFKAYLAIAGAEHCAAAIGRQKSQEYLLLIANILKEAHSKPLEAAATLVQGDLFLAAGDKNAALKSYRQAAGLKAAEPVDLKQQSPAFYFVEPPPSCAEAYAQVFFFGPGSHRDNWLIRRFIALEAWDDAAREFQRIHGIHRRCAGKAGFDGRGLEFALDYYYFLNQRQRQDEALTALLEPLLRIDMDRNPSLRAAVRPWFGPIGEAGVSRDEFIRLAYGAFKTAGKEDALIGALTKQIEAGRNAARRTLARVRVHQGKLDEALVLELDYIKEAGFNAFTAAYRRGLVYESLERNADAVKEYEALIALSPAPVNLPDEDEETARSAMMVQAVKVRDASVTPETEVQLDTLRRLNRIYSALGETQKALDVTLRQFALSEAPLRDFAAVEQLSHRFQSLGQEAKFAQWAKERLAELQEPAARANLTWVCGDFDGAARAVAQMAAGNPGAGWEADEWKRRFQEAGKEKFRILLNALIAANPKDDQSRLELLALEDRSQGDETTRALESLLRSDAPQAFLVGKGVQNRTEFRNYFDLAYRLMRIYEKQGKLENIRVLGLRIAHGEKPFGRWWNDNGQQYAYREENSMPEDTESALSLAVQDGDDASLAAMAEAFADLPDMPAKRQLQRRQAGGWKPESERAIEWANLPAGVQGYVCNEDVLSLALDENYIYAGMPWGVAVYAHDGKPVKRVALGDAATQLLAHKGILWAGTPIGLFRIQPDNWQVAHLPLDRVSALAADGEYVWIGGEKIQRLDPRTNSLRAYSVSEDNNGVPCADFFVEDKYIWASGQSGSARYDRAADRWQLLTYESKPVKLIGSAHGLLWGNLWLNDELRNRPCLIDRDSLSVKPILIEGLPPDQRMINGPFSYCGTYEGKPLLNSTNPGGLFVYDSGSGKLRPLDQSALDPTKLKSSVTPGLLGGLRWRNPDGVVACYDDSTEFHEPLPGFHFNAISWSIGALPDGTGVLAARLPDSPRYQYREESSGRFLETRDEDGGLHLISPAGQVRRISSVVTMNTLPGDRVNGVVTSPAYGNWVCTSRGIAALSEQGAVLRWFTRADGLCANRVAGGAFLDTTPPRFCFATGWGDHGGGLALYDPKTFIFTSLVRSDGLATDFLAGVTTHDRKVELQYGPEYMRNADGEYRLYPSAELDPESLAVTSGGEPTFTKEDTLHIEQFDDQKAMPFIGGVILSKAEHHGTLFLCGTRGMISIRGNGAAELKIEEIECKIEEIETKIDNNSRTALLADALERPLEISTPEDLAKALRDSNPFYRARALVGEGRAGDISGYLPLVMAASDDSDLRVRCTAVYILTLHLDDENAVVALKKRLADKDDYVRAVAAIAVARTGHVPDLALLEEILKHKTTGNNPHYGNFPFGADSSVGVRADPEMLCEAIAPHATAPLFALFMKYPIQPPMQSDPELNANLFEALGRSLRAHPEASGVLLAARNTPENLNWEVRFAQAIFKFAGKELLPVLHNALTSPDRVVRSNAALACGAIGDPASIPLLIKALDLESGLARASIVEAFGQLKAREALPQLARLYVDARSEQRRQASGYLMAQAQSEIGSQYRTIARLEDIGGDWDELKSSLAPAALRPREDEALMTPEGILSAIRMIGPDAAQDFYRSLAGDKDAAARQEAARELAEGDKQEIAKNLPILENLLADTEATVRISAAASLVILNQGAGRKVILDFLASPTPWERMRTLRELLRIQNAGALAFAREKIEVLAKDNTVQYETREEAQKLLEKLQGR